VVERTLAWMLASGMSYANFEVATPFPGTPLYAQALAAGWVDPLRLDDLLDGDPKLGFNGVIDRAGMAELQDRALRRFYFRPARLAKELLDGDLGENLRFVARSGWRFLRAGLTAAR
jgi:hypothetical protein